MNHIIMASATSECVALLMTDVGDAAAGPATPQLTVSAAFMVGWRRGGPAAALRPLSMEADEFLTLLHGSDPVKVEL